ncbi:MAG: hypothetical protein FJ387_18680 [Verrucomicrobia bacterium]|nr:hypothetical protein [Verrucomicrobiota bacterium]
MFTTIRKHQTWLWAFIIAATIVSFVIFFTPNVDLSPGQSMRSSGYGTMNGRAIPRKDYLEARVEAMLGFFFRYGTFPDGAEARRFGYSLERETANRLVMIDRLRELEVRVEEGAVADWILDNFSEARQATVARANYERLVRSPELGRYGITEADVQRYIRHQIGLQHLVAVAGVMGQLVPPRDAAERYRQENETIAAEAIVWSGSEFLPRVTVDPTALAQFYTNRQSVYRVAEKAQVDFVKFASSNYLAQAEEALQRNTNLTAELDREYLQYGPNAFTGPDGQSLTAEAAKQKIRERRLQEQAMLVARREAAKFGNELDKLTPLTAESLVNLAAAKGLVAGVSEPFTETEGPSELRLRGPALEVPFKLTADAPVHVAPLPGEDGYYLIALKQRLPSVLPPLDAIRTRVLEEYQRDQALQLARQAGTQVASAITNGLAQGRAFSELCAEANVMPIALPEFSLSARSLPGLDPRLDLSQVRMAALALRAGQASEFRRTADGGFLLHVRARTPVSEAELKEKLPDYLAAARQSEQYEGFDEWFRHQHKLTGIDTIRGRDDEGPLE